MREPHRRRRRLAGLAITLASLGGAAWGGADVKAQEGASHVGVWDLKVEGGPRQCRLFLHPDAAGPGFMVAMPVGCHRAFPILSTVAIWTDPGDGKLQLDDSTGQPVLSFEPGPDGVLAGPSPEGEIYRLEPVGPHKPKPSAVPAEPAVEPLRPAASLALPPAAPDPKQARVVPPKAIDMPGYFSVLRDKDTGCMITFDAKVPGPKGSFKAHLAPACRDQGIIIFDPVGWQLVGGRLVLTARKGHTAKFDYQLDGTWLKDPKDGKRLSLKKM